MARHGENIRKRKDGRWEGRYRIYSEEKRKVLYRSVYGKSYQEAREKLDAKKLSLKNGAAEKSSGDWPSQENIRFAVAAGAWLARLRQERKPSTYAKYSLIYRTHIKPALQEALLSQITEPFVHENLSGPYSGSVQKSVYCVLNQILRFASKEYAVVIPAVKRPFCDLRPKPVETFSKREQTRLLSVLNHETDASKAAVLLCLYTGLRLGEVCALKWEDVDFENRLLSVNRTVQRLADPDHPGKTALRESEPKSQNSRREIPLSADASELLLTLRHGKDYIFGGNGPLEPRTMQYRFKKYLRTAKLPGKNFHILRHTFATNCIEGGADVKSLSEILGHADVQITLNRYVHPTMDTKRRYLEALAQFYGQIHGQEN